MLDLYRAEWKKVFTNIKLTGFLVWIFPVGYLAFYTVMITLSLLSETMLAGVEYFGSGSWTQDGLAAWHLMVFFPSNLFARMLPLAFMAVVFAGEYQWRTWKNIVPRNRRWKLLLAKMAALVSLVMLSLLATAIIAVFGPSTGHRIHGITYQPSVSMAVIGNFLLDTLRSGFIALLSLIILVGYAAIFAIITRSVLGGLLMGFGFSILDVTSLGLLLFLSSLFDNRGILNLYQFTPTYNLSNMHTWLLEGHAQLVISAGVPFLTSEPGFWLSFLILCIWMLLLISIPLILFQHQEITE